MRWDVRTRWHLWKEGNQEHLKGPPHVPEGSENMPLADFWLCILISLCLQVPAHTTLYLLLFDFGDPVHYLPYLILSYLHRSHPYFTRLSHMGNETMSNLLLYLQSSGLGLHLSVSGPLGATRHTAMTVSTSLCFKLVFTASLSFICPSDC